MQGREPFLATIIINALLLLGAFIILLPFAWMIFTSFRAPQAVLSTDILFWPDGWNVFENYRRVLAETQILRFMINGVLVCGAIVILQVAIAAPCGYALAKLDFPGRSWMFAFVLIGLLIPIQIPALPLYVAIANAKLLNTYTALILPFAVSVFAIFLFRQFFKTFPDNIIDAARLDGYGELEIVWRIVMPSAWPAVSAFAIFSVVAHWNDLYWPLVVVTSPEMMTPPYGIMFFRERADGGAEIGALMASGVLVTAPLVLAFLFAQKHFIRGLTMVGPGKS